MAVEYNSRVEGIQQQAVQASTEGRYNEAERTLIEALDILAAVPFTPLVLMHQGRVQRDLFLNGLRAGNPDPRDIEASIGLITEVRGDVSERHRKAELGASVGALARWATFTNQRSLARRSYRQAALLLMRGDNAYYFTSNAMSGAKEAIIGGRRIGRLGWLATAVAGVAWAALANRKNLYMSAGTFKRRLPDIKNKAQAKASLKIPNRR